jgi:hypothetical protein
MERGVRGSNRLYESERNGCVCIAKWHCIRKRLWAFAWKDCGKVNRGGKIRYQIQKSGGWRVVILLLPFFVKIHSHTN